MARIWPLLLVAASAVVAGCASTRWGGFSLPESPDNSGSEGFNLAAAITYWAAICSWIGFFVLLGAKVSGFIFVPRKAISGVLVIALSTILVLNLLGWMGSNDVLGSVVLAVVVGVSLFWPAIHGRLAAKHKKFKDDIRRQGEKLARDPREARAAAAVLSLVEETGRSRKSILHRIQAADVGLSERTLEE